MECYVCNKECEVEKAVVIPTGKKGAQLVRHERCVPGSHRYMRDEELNKSFSEHFQAPYRSEER